MENIIFYIQDNVQFAPYIVFGLMILAGLNFPISEDLSKKVLSLPMHTELEDEQLKFICDNIKNFFKSD